MKKLEDFIFLKPDIVAKILKVSKRTVYRYCENGLKYYKIGNSYRFDAKDVLEFSKNRKI